MEVNNRDCYVDSYDMNITVRLFQTVFVLSAELSSLSYSIWPILQIIQWNTRISELLSSLYSGLKTWKSFGPLDGSSLQILYSVV